MKKIVNNGHVIEIQGWGREKVIYDGRMVSSTLSMVDSTHVFLAHEDGEEVQYEVNLALRWHWCSYWCEVRRKDEIIYTDR